MEFSGIILAEESNEIPVITKDAPSLQVAWVDEGLVCDGVKDCNNGLDECAGCEHGALTSEGFLIRNMVS